MKWNELSDDAKSILEWVENPFTNKRESICIQIGDYFVRECKKYSTFSCKYKDIKILVTKDLHDEILEYINNDKNLQAVGNLSGELIFSLKKEVIL